MDITLTLPPETERLLEQEARREGMDRNRLRPASD